MKIVKDFNIKEYSQKLIDWLSDTCTNYLAEGFVIGLSGGYRFSSYSFFSCQN